MAETTTAKKGFSAAERAAMQARAKEVQVEAKANKNRAEGERDLLAKIADMPEPDRSMATQIHAIVSESAPGLAPKTWYGMPAYTREGKVVCFFKAASKFGNRYATLGFSDEAHLDDGALWPTDFAVNELTADAEDRIRALVTKAVS